MEMGDSTLYKQLKKRENYPYNDQEALYIYTQILLSYKFFFKRGIVYRFINPRNCIKFGK